MNRQYEVYVNGILARRHITFGGAEKTMAKFPNAKGQIFRVIPSVEVVLMKTYEPAVKS